jgi:hypothetical protein
MNRLGITKSGVTRLSAANPVVPSSTRRFCVNVLGRLPGKGNVLVTAPWLLVSELPSHVRCPSNPCDSRRTMYCTEPSAFE